MARVSHCRVSDGPRGPGGCRSGLGRWARAALLVIGLWAGEARATDGAETSLINPAPDLIKDSDVVLRQDDGTGTTSIHNLTFDSSKNPVTLTVFNCNTLTISSVSPTTLVSTSNSRQ